MEITLRNAKTDDLALLLTYRQASYAQDHRPFDEMASRAALLDLLAHPELGQVWLICLNSDPIGYVVLTFGYRLGFQGRGAFLDELYLEASHRGRGLSARVMKTVELIAKSLGLQAIHVEVAHNNERAQRYYRSLGFQDRSQFSRMSKRLAPG
jgi:ribosomal protein S18 acetylase RimI-like enzyme